VPAPSRPLQRRDLTLSFSKLFLTVIKSQHARIIVRSNPDQIPFRGLGNSLPGLGVEEARPDWLVTGQRGRSFLEGLSAQGGTGLTVRAAPM
jgi:hypothetical protein